jgi:hypothetical protein
MSGHKSAENHPTASIFHMYTDFTNEIDLTDGSQGPSGVCARALQVMTTGNLVVKRIDSASETIVGCFVGFQLAGACSAIKKASDGTTVTQVIAYW